MAAHFGEMLLDRRRQLGLSIQQVANIIKIRPQIIEYFECENFAAMPPRGYAQGMISSYARYLGLNPREVVDAYFDALHSYERGLDGGRVGRLQDSVADASPRSANATSRFLMVNNAASAGSRFAARPPQAGYVSESVSPHEPLAATRMRPANDRYGDTGGRPRRNAGARPAPGGRGYAGADGRAPRSRRGYSDAPHGSGAAASRGYGYAGRAGQPGVQRRPAAGGNARGGQGSARRGGSSATRGRGGAQGAYPIDSRVLMGGLIALIVIIVLLAVLLMRGCAPKPAADTGSADAPKTAPVDTSDKGKEDSSADSDGADADADDAEADAAVDPAADGADTGDGTTPSADGAAGTDAQQPQETKVKVKLSGEGTVAWIEVDLDGSSVLAAQQVGPFEQEFTVTQQIEVVTNKPSDVSVYVNGKKVRYDMKASGVAKVTITVPKTDAVDPATGDGTADAGTPAPQGAAPAQQQ